MSIVITMAHHPGALRQAYCEGSTRPSPASTETGPPRQPVVQAQLQNRASSGNRQAAAARYQPAMKQASSRVITPAQASGSHDDPDRNTTCSGRAETMPVPSSSRRPRAGSPSSPSVRFTRSGKPRSRHSG